MFRVLVADKLGQPGLDRLGQDREVSFDVRTGLSKAQLVDVIGDYDALIMRSATTVDADVLAAGSKLKVVGRAGIGVDNVDVRAATARGVIVTTEPRRTITITAISASGSTSAVRTRRMSSLGRGSALAGVVESYIFGTLLAIGCSP